MKRLILITVLLGVFTPAFAFDWKPQTNEVLRNDMFSFMDDFIKGLDDMQLTAELKAFVGDQKQKAVAEPYAWIKDTHDFVDSLLERYPAELSEGGGCSYVRRKLLLLRDYPMHSDNKVLDAPQEQKAAYRNSILSLYADAEAGAMAWLKEGRRSRELDIYKVYNMGYLFRSAGKVVAVDLQWSGNEEQMAEFAALVDVFFVTHPHSDHYNKALLEAVLKAGKTVVLPSDIVPEYKGSNKVLVTEAVLEPMKFGKISFVSRMGNQGEAIPCNVYLISLGKWNIADNGDNYIDEAETYLSSARVDVLVAACWNKIKDTMTHIKANPEGTECIYFSSHENEWKHTVDHRESYEELFRRSDRLGDKGYDYLPTVVMDAAGDRFILK